MQGLQWVKLTQEEIPSRIQAITGKRGRPRNAEKEKAKAKEAPKVKRGRGRPPKAKMADLLSKTDARLLKKLEAQGTLPRVPCGPCALRELICWPRCAGPFPLISEQGRGCSASLWIRPHPQPAPCPSCKGTVQGGVRLRRCQLEGVSLGLLRQAGPKTAASLVLPNPLHSVQPLARLSRPPISAHATESNGSFQTACSPRAAFLATRRHEFSAR